MHPAPAVPYNSTVHFKTIRSFGSVRIFGFSAGGLYICCWEVTGNTDLMLIRIDSY
jgi:hypothetical protein